MLKNKVNGKMYIGQTTRDIKIRLKEHFSVARLKNKKYSHYIHRAINLYGEKNFEIKIICSCNNQKMLNQMEIACIKHFEAQKDKNGYNLNYSSSKGVLCQETKDKISASRKDKKAVKCLETNEAFESITEAAKIKNMSRSDIRYCCDKKRRTAGKFHWAYIDDDITIDDIENLRKENISNSRKGKKTWNKGKRCPQLSGGNNGMYKQFGKQKTSKKVVCMDLKGNEIKIFLSVGQAVNWLKEQGHKKANSSPLSAACRGLRQTLYGYKWRYIDANGSSNN
jgi:group I intron endonuclease